MTTLPRPRSFGFSVTGTLLLVASVWMIVPFAKESAQRQDRPRPRPGELPLGEWRGSGTFVYQHWGKDSEGEAGEGEAAEGGYPTPDEFFETSDDVVDLLEDDSAGDGVVHRRYRTELSIWEEPWDDRDVIVMEIRSRRGELAELGEETHLLTAFEESRRLSRSTVLYRMISFAFNPARDYEPTINESASPVAASCTTTDDVTVFQIHYMDNFVDTIRFENNCVEKIGMYHTRDGLVHWTEELKKR